MVCVSYDAQTSKYGRQESRLACACVCVLLLCVCLLLLLVWCGVWCCCWCGVECGQVLVKPGSVTPHTKFEAEVYILTKDEGGRHTPFFANYRPQFYFRTTDVTGTVELPSGTEMVMPGDNLKFDVELINPIAMEQGLRFAIREGGRTVGSGVVSKIIA